MLIWTSIFGSQDWQYHFMQDSCINWLWRAFLETKVNQMMIIIIDLISQKGLYLLRLDWVNWLREFWWDLQRSFVCLSLLLWGLWLWRLLALPLSFAILLHLILYASFVQHYGDAHKISSKQTPALWYQKYSLAKLKHSVFTEYSSPSEWYQFWS